MTGPLRGRELISSREQREGYSIDAQLRANREKAETERWAVIREFAVAESARRGADRASFREMLLWVKKGARREQIGAILSHKLDRICRNMRDAVRLQALEDDCGVRLAFVENQFGRGAAGALSFNVMAAVAQYYSDNLRGEVLKGMDERVRQGWPSGAHRGWEAMLADFLPRARAMLQTNASIRDVGVSIGGPLNPLTGVVLSPPHLPGWDNVPLAEILKRELGLEVTVEHDAAACLLAEWLWGAAMGASHAVYLTCGTGCGAGILIDGRILRGPTGQSPEVGHVRLAAGGPEMFGKHGCVESFCSGEGIAKLAPHMFPERFNVPTDTRTLHDLAEAGDEPARAVLCESARRMGQTCAMLADIFSPEIIVLGSLATYLQPWWLDEIREAFAGEALATNASDTRIVAAGLAGRLQDLSAVAPREARDRPNESSPG